MPDMQVVLTENFWDLNTLTTRQKSERRLNVWAPNDLGSTAGEQSVITLCDASSSAMLSASDKADRAEPGEGSGGVSISESGRRTIVFVSK